MKYPLYSKMLTSIPPRTKIAGSRVSALFKWLPPPLHVASGAPAYSFDGKKLNAQKNVILNFIFASTANVKPLTANRGLRLGVNKINVNLKVSIYEPFKLIAKLLSFQLKRINLSILNYIWMIVPFQKCRHTHLGLTLQNNLPWKKHIYNIASSAGNSLFYYGNIFEIFTILDKVLTEKKFGRAKNNIYWKFIHIYKAKLGTFFRYIYYLHEYNLKRKI